MGKDTPDDRNFFRHAPNQSLTERVHDRKPQSTLRPFRSCSLCGRLISFGFSSIL